MSGKKKNAVTLIILCALLVVCLILYFVIPRSNGEKEESATDSTEEQSDSESISLDSIAADQIKSVAVTKKEKKVWSLKKKNKSWNLVGKEAAPVNEETVSSILENVKPVTATQKFENQSGDLSLYGLDKPELTISIITTDGATYRYDIGSEVPKSDMGYYGKCSGRDEIYCLNSTLVKAFDVSGTSLIKMDELPKIDEDYLTAIRVQNKKGKGFAAKKVGDAEKVDFYSNWNITAPYAKPLATSQSEWSTVLGYFSSLTYEEMVEYDSRNLQKYGLKNPQAVISVNYYQAKKGYSPSATATPNANVSGTSSSESSYVIPENKRDYKSLKLCVGEKEGDSYYVCEQGKKNVYKMSADAVGNITGLDAYTNMDHCVYSVLATSINGYDVTYGDTTLKVTRKSVPKDASESAATPKATPTAAENGTAVGNATDSSQKNIWTLNGKKISDEDERDFLSPYSLAYLLEYSGKAKDSVKPESEEPVLTIVYHEEKRDVTVKYLPYDGINFYRVEKNGMDYFLVDKLSVDDVIEKFKGIEKFAK